MNVFSYNHEPYEFLYLHHFHPIIKPAEKMELFLCRLYIKTRSICIIIRLIICIIFKIHILKIIPLLPIPFTLLFAPNTVLPCFDYHCILSISTRTLTFTNTISYYFSSEIKPINARTSSLISL